MMMNANDNVFDVIVVGAGPSGIATIAAVVDGELAKSILWMDPAFTCGMFDKYTNVPSNTKVRLFKEYFKAFNCFDCDTTILDQYNQDAGCDLGVINNLLRKVTLNLQRLVSRFAREFALKIDKLDNSVWRIETNENNIYCGKRVFACIGSHPKEIDTNCCKIIPSLIPFEVSIDRQLIGKHVNDQDVVIVYGSRHSAMLAIMNLIMYSNVGKVINVYTKPLLYAEYEKQDIINDNTGLKGIVAQWTRSNLETNDRIYRTMNQNDAQLALATKSVVAIGFERNTIKGLPSNYDPVSGALLDENGKVDGLWGFGIAYPAIDREGAPDVGLWKFIKQLKRNELFKK